MVGVLSSGSNGLGHSIRVHQYSLAGDIIEEAPCRIVQFGIPYRTSRLLFILSYAQKQRSSSTPQATCELLFLDNTSSRQSCPEPRHW